MQARVLRRAPDRAPSLPSSPRSPPRPSGSPSASSRRTFVSTRPSRSLLRCRSLPSLRLQPCAPATELPPSPLPLSGSSSALPRKTGSQLHRPQSSLLTYADNLSRTVRGPCPAGSTFHPPQTEASDADSTPPWEAAEDTTHQRGQPIQLDLARRPHRAGYAGHQHDGAERRRHSHRRVRIRPGILAALRREPRSSAAPQAAGQVPDSRRLRCRRLSAGAGRRRSRQHLRRDDGQSGGRRRLRSVAACTPPRRVASTRLVRYADSSENQRLPPFLRLTQPDAEMLNAMLFGDRTGLTQTMRTGFERTGTFHLFVVSGLHIALIAAGLYWLVRRLRGPGVVRDTSHAARRYRVCGTHRLRPARAARALTMTAVFLVARLLSRDRDALNALGAAVLAMLLIAPVEPLRRQLPDDRARHHRHRRHCGPARPPDADPERPADGSGLRATAPHLRARTPPKLILMLELWGDAFAQILPRGAYLLDAAAHRPSRAPRPAARLRACPHQCRRRAGHGAAHGTLLPSPPDLCRPLRTCSSCPRSRAARPCGPHDVRGVAPYRQAGNPPGNADRGAAAWNLLRHQPPQRLARREHPHPRADGSACPGPRSSPGSPVPGWCAAAASPRLPPRSHCH